MKHLPYLSSDGRLDLWSICRDLAETLLHGHPHTLNQVLGMIRARDVNKIASLGKFADEEYQSSDINEILALRQISALFKKNSAFSDERVCSQTAQNTFTQGERICRIANKRLDHYYSHRDRLPEELNSDLLTMEREIAHLLGDVDADFLARMDKRIRLTNGATEDRTRRRALPFLKITGKLRAPRRAVPHLGRVLTSYGVDLEPLKFTSVEHNTVVMVPKNWKTHRTIAKEPTHSLPFQLALDQLLKRRLMKWGVDLGSQERNQQLALEGSRTGKLCTVDLSMASDTLCYNAVAWLLPMDFVRLLDCFRSKRFRASWGTGEYAKYSSMGNGYTFSLETLIFTAAARAIGSKCYAVYGDDIVVESVLFPRLLRLLTFLGFSINKEKSFVNPASLFRESCGHDYYDGRLVTPFYLRENPRSSDRSSLCHVINGLVSVSHPGPLWTKLAKLVKGLKLRCVPLVEDSRVGIHIPAAHAWKHKLVYTDRRRGNPGGPFPSTYGFPVFKGYGPVQRVRKTRGWRSFLLWFIMNQSSDWIASNHTSQRTSSLLLSMNAGGVDHLGSVATSQVVDGTRYCHKTVRYCPNSIADHIIGLWADELGFSLAN